LSEGGLELRAAMRIHTHATREEFERAAQHGGDGLRAWTSFDVVDFAPLADWTNSDDDAVIARLTHELCHAAVEQRFGTRERAHAARIPRFFTEGACTLVAGQERVDVGDATIPDDDAFDANPAAAYARAYRTLLPLQARLGKRIFARILDDAAADGKPGCMLRALHAAGVDTTIASP
jgi:hypothetical protein